MEKNVLLYTCNMLYIFLYQIFKITKFNKEISSIYISKQSQEIIKKRRADLLLYILVNL